MEEIQKEDYQELATFLAFHWKHESRFWLERFQFLWDKNPCFPQDPIRGLVAKQDNIIKGFIGKFPVKIQLDGQETVSSNAIGMLLDPDLRGTGLGKQLKDKHTELSRGKLVFATSPNKISMKINTSLGFKLLPRGIGNYNLYSIVPIRRWGSTKLYSYLLGSSLKSSGSILPLKVIGADFYRNKQHKKFKTLRAEKIDHAGEEFDRLWTSTKTIYKNTHIRNAEIINWYLLPTQYADREVYAAYEKNELAGYIVVRLSSFKAVQFMLCLDLWLKPDNHQNTIINLIHFAKEQALDKDCSALLLPHFSKSLSDTLDKMGLIKAIGTKRNDLFLKPQTFNGPINVENSYFTYMSGDRFLVKAII